MDKEAEMMFRVLSFTVIITLFLLVLGCSKGGNDLLAPGGEPDLGTAVDGDSQHRLWGFWEVHFDTDTLSVNLEPVRGSLAHFDITPMLLPPSCNNCVFFVLNSFDPISRILDVDVTLRNPTGIAGRDVRGILFTNDYGHLLNNWDDWTALWDPPEGEPRNPFKAFAKYKANRIFEGHGEYTENYLIKIPTPPHWASIKFAIDVSWPGNCKEPYTITNFTQGHITEDVGSSAYVTVDVKDWQNDVSKVTFCVPAITGESFTQLSHLSGDTWRVKLVNNTGTLNGNYGARVIANSSNSGDLVLYDYVTIHITEANTPGLPIDVTPPWLNLNPFKVCYDGTYAYAASGWHGLVIFDVSSPVSPTWVNSVETLGAALVVAVDDGYAYVGADNLQIYDIDPPESACLVNTIYLPDELCHLVDVRDGYAYAVSVGWLYIIDISAPGAAHIVNEIELPQTSGYDTLYYAMDVSDGYAYITGWADETAGDLFNGFLVVVDVDPPSGVSVIKNLAFGSYTSCADISVSGSYAYLAHYKDFTTYSIYILNVADPADPQDVKFISMPSAITGIDISNGIATVAGDNFFLIDAYPPESAYIITTIDIPDTAYSVDASGGYACVGSDSGLHMIDIEPAGSAYLAGTFESMGNTVAVCTSGNYIYGGLFGKLYKVVDTSIPEDATIINSVASLGLAIDMDYNIDLVYSIRDYTNDIFEILDVDPPLAASIVKSLSVGQVDAVATWGVEYAYVAHDSVGDISVIDINPVSSAYVVGTIDVGDRAMDVDVQSGYAYIAAYSGGLRVYDVDPFGSASFVDSNWTVGYAKSVCVQGDYAFVGTDTGMTIIDINPPDDLTFVTSVFVGDVNDVFVECGYAYLAVSGEGLKVIDVYPPESACLLSEAETPGAAVDVCTYNNYAYVADGLGGLRIFKLW